MRQRFGELLDSAGHMFWELDRNFRVVFANDFLKKIFGDPIGHVCYKFMAGAMKCARMSGPKGL